MLKGIKKTGLERRLMETFLERTEPKVSSIGSGISSRSHLHHHRQFTRDAAFYLTMIGDNWRNGACDIKMKPTMALAHIPFSIFTLAPKNLWPVALLQFASSIAYDTTLHCYCYSALPSASKQ